ncbi:exodeoxyribonuclease V subunit beta [Chitinolyticbacter meiyuanensis]|uniref:exodeoxyribonuclease V subunit beta n=1 Tax=Chitinolyticbacter meiyuanensis TaxID=682798 RepID=UPI0011E5F1D8|nr:exodeoxyribonuclease V subunit beta [Chitinolyticbacter meiyuanensis]
MSRPLALTLPLSGSRLIEASAGTGKTYTISALYLRLVLGHGGELAHARPLLPPDILVVTFTEAATQELRDRIRARLVEAAHVFRDEQPPDAVLAALRADYPEADWPQCARRLEIAAQWMDEAAVATIHGWSQRMLREHAFDSGSLFTQTLRTDESALRAEAVRDYWRMHCYPLTGDALAWVASRWRDPDTLARQLLPLGDNAGADRTLAEVLSTPLAGRSTALAALKAPWSAWSDQLEALLDDAVASKKVNGRKIQPRYYQPWLAALRTWAADAELAFPELSQSAYDRFALANWPENWNGAPPQHGWLDAALAALTELPSALAALPDPAADALTHASSWVSARMAREKLRRAELGFDDMLTRLDAALTRNPQLAAVIRRQFPVALIDEFQDTDPLQYRIFDAIYQVADNRPDTALLLIGDPKQAIYGFRGADIHTYLAARMATAGRHASLDTNFRSSHAMVDAVNRVFASAEQHPRGAFLFKQADGNPLPFLPVKARGRAERWLVNGKAAPALTLWHQASEAPLPGGRYVATYAEACASAIVRLLQLGQDGKAGFTRDGQLTPLRPGDIAVLVRNGREAQAIRAALAVRQVKSVYLSDKDSVYASAEARDLLFLLRACAEPGQDRALRAALACRTLALPLADLARLNDDERHWEARVLQFRDYHARWQQAGVLAMLRQLMGDFALPQRLLSRDDGERALTNLLHLAELLQQAAATLDGELALVRHLADSIAEHSAAADEQVLRLESDEGLLRVVTVHKSKGLEYPLVFLPFACSLRPVDGDKPLWVREDGRRALRFKPSVDDVARADDERLAEDVRLMYVALTRARHGCWLGLADLTQGRGRGSQLHRSAIGYLLTGGEPLASPVALGDALQAWAQPGVIAVAPAPRPDQAPLQMALAFAPALAARQPLRAAREHWWIASYSALRLTEVASNDERIELVEGWGARLGEEERLPGMRLTAPPPLGDSRLHRFARGPGPGSFLHGLLEWAGREGFARIATEPALARDLIARRAAPRGWQGWIDPLAGALGEWLVLPLLEYGTALRTLTRYQVELEFWFAAQRVDVTALDALVSAGTEAGAPRPPCGRQQLNGMFKGFIDLVFEHAGRYYVVDYKSNWLGEHDDAYTPAAMREAMLSHRYDLQYTLYTLALHRQLRARLPDYDYERHVGGIAYVFLRGQHADGHGIHRARPSRALIDALDALFRGDRS